MSRGIPKHVFDHWTAFGAALNRKPHLILLCDFDGTLSAIKPKPGQAFLPKRTLRHLKDLRALRSVTLGVVSGRSLADVRRKVSLRSLWYIGNHGAEISGPGVRFVHPEIKAAVPVLRKIARELRAGLRSFDGGAVEDKIFSLSVHWRRLAPDQRRAFLEQLDAIVRPYAVSKAVKVTTGKCVREVRAPVVWDKGRGIAWLIEHLNKPDALVMYIGDDVTDEDGFRVVNAMKGLSVLVGTDFQSTRAQWRVDSPLEVQKLLGRMRRLPGRLHER